MARVLSTLFVCIALTACGGSDATPPVPTPLGVAPLLAAGAVPLEPTLDDAFVAAVDMGRLGAAGVVAAYDVTTPAGEPFAFDVLARRAGNAGRVRVSVANAEAGGAETLAQAGFVISAAGRQSRGPWLDAVGDGFARLTLRGQIEEEQILALEANDGGGAGLALIRLRIGPASAINVAALSEGDHPDIASDEVIYSSDAWAFGLPTAAVSGDRTSIVVYEGDRADPQNYARYEMRLQHDAVTGLVTGGGEDAAGPDSGNWRDHEIAALYNVLVRAQAGGEDVEVALSFDRGATFDTIERFSSGSTFWRPRLVQVAMALDYTLAVLFWRTNDGGASELILVEGQPSAFDGDGSPTAFAFADETVVHRAAGDVTPMLMAAAYSEGGDLVVGYGYTSFDSRPDGTWRSVTQSRCAVRLWGEAWSDLLVEEEVMVGKDPSVALLGQGDTLRIFYAYEARDGVRLSVSDDAGQSFSPPVAVGDASAHMPQVFARERDGGVVVDVLYLAQAPEGMELHAAHWPAWGQGGGATYRLTRARMESSGDLPPDRPVPGGGFGALPPDYGFRVTQVAWFGYDACLDGDAIVAVVDEETFDGAIICLEAPGFGPEAGGVLDAPTAPEPFVPAEPPPLAPGMTETMPLPDPDHMHQLRLIRIE